MEFVNVLLVGLLVGSDMLVLTLIHKHNAKKCKYNCDKCKNWDCPVHDCRKHWGE